MWLLWMVYERHIDDALVKKKKKKKNQPMSKERASRT